MNTERLSRRDFIKLSGAATAGLMSPSWLKEAGENVEPLTNLPIFYTKNTPVHLEFLTLGGNRIDSTLSANADYKPTWVTLSDMPISIIPPIKPDRSLTPPNAVGAIAWVADAPHITARYPTLTKVVVGYSDLFDHYPRLQTTGSLMRKEWFGIKSTYLFTDKQNIYPAKIYNILTALASISEWQKDNGGLKPGETYSYLEMSGVTKRNADRYINLRGFLDAAGVCASVSTISKTVLLASAQGLATVIARREHDHFKYSANPLDPGITIENSDATVEWIPGSDELYLYNTDYRFKISEDSPPLYLEFKVQVDQDENTINPNHPGRHKIHPADARLTFTVTLTENQPSFDEQISNIYTARKSYADFHNFEDGFL